MRKLQGSQRRVSSGKFHTREYSGIAGHDPDCSTAPRFKTPSKSKGEIVVLLLAVFAGYAG
jgi:hypothetical protein